MTKTEQAQRLFAVVTDTSAPVVTRQEAKEQLVALKKAARVSFSKLGVDETAIPAEFAETATVAETATETATAPAATRGKRGEKRDQAVALLATVADKPRREQVQFLMDEMGINANAAYYFARTCQS